MSRNSDLSKLPRYIEAPGGGMWGPMPDGFNIANEDAIFVKLKDVEALVTPTVTSCERIVMHAGVEYISVGYGGEQLVKLAQFNGWHLHSWNSEGIMTSGWRGNTASWEYFIKK